MNLALWVMGVAVVIACGLFGLAASLTVTPNEIADSLPRRPSAAPDGGWGERVDCDARSPHEGAS